jgi:hypothetical protein
MHVGGRSSVDVSLRCGSPRHASNLFFVRRRMGYKVRDVMNRAQRAISTLTTTPTTTPTTNTTMATKLRGLALAGGLALTVAIGVAGGIAAGCGDPNQGAGERCTVTTDCDPPLVCSNRDHSEQQGICVWPEALPDAAVSQDASGAD